MSTIPLKHGVFLAPYHPIEEGPTTWMRRDLELCQILDDLGFDEVWVGEHHSGGYEMISSPELFIAAAAEMTKRIHFGTGVITLPYHNPLMTANRIAQLDHQTRGRVSFGVGPGLLMMDALMMGLDPNKTRDMMLEALEVILRLLRGEEVSAKGSWYELVKARAHLLPYSQPLPEFAVASAGTPSGGRAAGKLGLSMLCVAASQIGAFDVLDTNWKIACETAEQHGHAMDPSKLRLVAPVHIAETRAKARENVRHGLERWAKYYEMVAPNPFPSDGRDIADVLIDSGRAVIGSPDDAIAMIERLRKKQGRFGVFLAQHVDWADWDQTRKCYELYARYVMPHFSNANANRLATYAAMRERNAELLKLRADASEQAFAKHEKELGRSVRA
ncbi:LLM class flavin-dependent oxidoreductase [Chelatococcus reniformis]|uniref:Monooxygenase (Luciferase-like) n=1 Tax=Chelatococcus reniformis TaxID=1494448 RepID=A0A916UMV3_9HYPH|nr:LLM class flavin-dependent oxidoreductase [Chelatococcus reniformis]GGC78070.1 putative monooxygenase (luciferase-like) [Chelatococcus reniformis]